MNAVTLSVLALAGFAAPATNPAAYRLSGPYTHANLSIFLIHGAGPPTKPLMTLQEAIAQHKVVVHETRSVNELAIENLSDQDVFIESGEIVKGGAQDRTFKDDIILPTKSGRVYISAFCVEPGRWSRRGAEPVAVFGSSTETVATKQLKRAVKVAADQSQVWNSVAQAQDRLSAMAGAGVRSPESPSSFAMTMAAPVTQRSIEGYLNALSGIAGGRNDVIGYAFAINGKLNSADVYASHDLFARLWPKLLRASAVEAVSEYDRAMKIEPLSTEAVHAALRDAESGQASSKKLNDRTQAVVRETAKNMLFETRDRGQQDAWIHRNYLTK